MLRCFLRNTAIKNRQLIGQSTIRFDCCKALFRRPPLCSPGEKTKGAKGQKGRNGAHGFHAHGLPQQACRGDKERHHGCPGTRQKLRTQGYKRDDGLFVKEKNGKQAGQGKEEERSRAGKTRFPALDRVILWCCSASFFKLAEHSWCYSASFFKLA